MSKEKKAGNQVFVPQPGHNKYEMVIVAARESRHLNELSRITGEPLPGKVTTIALGRVLDEEVPFTYEEPAPTPPPTTES